MDTMELHHCRHCGQDKPADAMRRDSSYKSGFRPQCLSCKRKMEAPTPPKRKKGSPRNRAPKKKLTAEERLYPCTKCGRDDVPFAEMTKDKRKFMGVGSVCLACRRSRNHELAEAERQRKALEAEERRRAAEGEWVYCYRCNSQHRPGSLHHPPAAVAAGFPEEARLCGKCMQRTTSREDIVRAERARSGLNGNATRKELESAARVAALRELAQLHSTDYRNLLRRHMDRLGVEQEKRWITL
jgi:uncharacterized protein with PIN domain